LKKLFLLLWVLILISPMFAAQRYVVAELFTATWCPYCPLARAALRTMADDSDTYPYLIPMLYQADSGDPNGPNPSPNYSQRLAMYYIQGEDGLPLCQFDGILKEVGGYTGNLADYTARYNSRVNVPSPISVNLTFAVNGSQLSANAVIVPDGTMENMNNTQVIFILTNDFSATQNPDYTISVVRYAQMPYSSGQESYSTNFELNAAWELGDLYLIAFVQNLGGNKEVYNGARRSLDLYPRPNRVISYSGPNTISLTWNQPNEEEAELEGWKVYRNGTLQTPTPITVKKYTDNDAISGQTYQYQVSAIYPDGTESPHSVEVSGAINDEGLYQLGSGQTAHANNAAGPINVANRSLHGQFMITLEELNLMGISGPSTITSLAFFVTNRPQYPLPQYQLRIKHTNAGMMNVNVPGPWDAIQFISSYQPAVGGWRFIELDEPFEWDGVRNIVIDTAFNQASASNSSGAVRVVLADSEHGYRYVRSNAGNQTDVATNSVANYRPQVRMTVQPVSETDEVLTPRFTKLGSNYPNPFNPSTTIYFDLHKTSFVTLEIFNIKGQLVATLANKEYESGRHFVIWNGSDSLGQRAGSGIYLYKLQTDGFAETKKMIMVK